MRQRRSFLPGAVQAASLLILSLPAGAQEAEPSLDFLEYLGSWEDDDETWYVEVQTAETQSDGKEEAGDQIPRATRVEHEDEQ